MSKKPGIAPKKPAPFWKRSFKVNKTFFISLGKVATNSFIGDSKKAGEQFVEALGAVGFEKDGGICWWVCRLKEVSNHWPGSSERI